MYSKQSILESGFYKNGILFRRACPADSKPLAKLYDDVYSGGYPIKECTDPVLVKQILESGKHLWLVAFEGDDLIAASVSKPDNWNYTYETCRAVTSAKHKGGGIGFTLYDMKLHTSFQFEDCDLVFGHARSQSMVNLINKANPPGNIVGTDLGMHIVSGTREIHLWTMTLNPSKILQRVEEEEPIYKKSHGLAGIIDQLRFRNLRGPYPKNLVVGEESENFFECEYGRAGYTYFKPSGLLSINSLECEDYALGKKTIWALIDDIAKEKSVEIASVKILSDKRDFLEKLKTPDKSGQRKFSFGAYLPGWFFCEGKRYDCLYLAARLYDSKPAIHGFEDTVKNFNSLDDMLQGL